MHASDKGTSPASESKVGPRLAAAEKDIAALRTSLEAQMRRIQTLQAQLDHLTARGPI